MSWFDICTALSSHKVKTLKTGAHKIITVICHKNKIVWIYNDAVRRPKDADVAYSANSDQTAL